MNFTPRLRTVARLALVIVVVGLVMTPAVDALAQKGGRGGGRGNKGGGFGGSFRGGGGGGQSFSTQRGGGQGFSKPKGGGQNFDRQPGGQGGFDRTSEFGNANSERSFTLGNDPQTNRLDSGFQNRPSASNQQNLLSDPSTTHRRMLTEQNKLNHRQQVADHLRQVSQQNGNPQLMEVADRLDQKALRHYEKQMNQIDPQWSDPLTNGSLNDPLSPQGLVQNDPLTADNSLAPTQQTPTSVLESSNPSVAESPLQQPTPTSIDPARLTGTQNAYQRRFQAAEQSLNQRLNVAEKLRTMGEAQSNPNLLEASRQMEEMALQRYTDQLSQLSDFSAQVPTTINP